jgi:hypothetical protein
MEFLQGRPYKRFDSPTRSILPAKTVAKSKLCTLISLAEEVDREFKRVDERCGGDQANRSIQRCRRTAGTRREMTVSQMTATRIMSYFLGGNEILRPCLSMNSASMSSKSLKRNALERIDSPLSLKPRGRSPRRLQHGALSRVLCR